MACAALVSTTARAAGAYLASTIKVVYPLGNGSFVLKFNHNHNSPACLGPENPQLFYVAVGQNGVTESGLKNMLAAAQPRRPEPRLYCVR